MPVYRLLGKEIGGQGPGTHLDGVPDCAVDKVQLQLVGT